MDTNQPKRRSPTQPSPPPSAPDVIGAVIERFYDAAVAPTLWSDAVDHLAAALGGAVVLLHLRFPDAESAGFAVAAGIDASYIERYATEFHAMDPFVETIRDLGPGVVVPIANCLDPAALSASAFHQHWMRPQRLLPTGGLVSLITRDGLQPCVTLHIFQRWGGSRLDEAPELVERLIPHLRRAVVVSEALQRQTQRLEIIEGLVSRGPLAVMLINFRDRLVWANDRANGLLSQGDELEIAEDGLRGLTAHANASLSHAVQAVRDGADDQVFRLRRHGERPPLTVLATLCAARTQQTGSTPNVALIVADPEHLGEVPVAQLRSLFGLTPAESRVAWLVGHGLRIDEVAVRLGVRVETARAHLKQIFDKAGVSRQAELVRLLLSSPVVLAQR